MLPPRAPQSIELAVEGDVPIVIPSRWCGPYIIVDVTLNNSATVALLLDTGSDTTVFDDGLADRFPESLLASEESVRGAEGETVMVRRQLRVESMRVGAVELGAFDAVMLDLDQISDALGEGIDGVMGFRSFYDVLLTVDYPARQVRVRRGTLSSDRFTSVLPMLGARSPSVEITIGDQTEHALIDTAGMSCLTLPRWDPALVETVPRPIGTSVTIGGVNLLERGRLGADVVCGPHVFERALFSPTSGGAKFGTDMLEEFAVTFDQRARLVRFDRAGLDDVPIRPEVQRGLGLGFDRRQDAWIVMHVFEDGPAGVRVGDRVLAIDGVPVYELGCGGFRDMMRTVSTCTLTIERESERSTINVPVVVQVP